MRLLLTRPLDDSRALAQKLEKSGHEVMIEPVLEISPLLVSPPDTRKFQALVFTSRHAISQFAALSETRDTKVFTVGEASANLARNLGFHTAVSAGVDARTTARKIASCLTPQAGPLYYGRGEVVNTDFATDLQKNGFTITSQNLYRAKPVTKISPRTQKALESGWVEGILFFSHRSAKTFVTLMQGNALKIPWQQICAYCLSRTVAEALEGTRWKQVIIPKTPSAQSLIGAIEKGSNK